jgi:hypothetical protein
MNARAIFSTIAAVAALSIAPTAAHAQNAAQAGERMVASYAFGATGQVRGMPARVVIADSAGLLVGRYYVSGEKSARPMNLMVDGRDIVLQGDTDRGLLELVLFGEIDNTRGGRINGRWVLGGEAGSIRGFAKP